MGQSLVKNYVHIVFSTKHRQPFIGQPHEEKLHNYLGCICNELGCQTIKIGGYTDHVHILCMLSKKVALVTLLEEIKKRSSKWMKTLDKSLLGFYWQDGYSAFSVNPARVDNVVAYISNQHQHHKNQLFQEELRGLLKKYQIEYDERYIWD